MSAEERRLLVSWTRLTGSIIGVTPSGVSATFSATLAAGQTVTESFRATGPDQRLRDDLRRGSDARLRLHGDERHEKW